MGGFIDPFLSSPAWPQDNASTGSSWAGSVACAVSTSLADSLGTYKGAASAEDGNFLGQDVSSSILRSGDMKQVMDKGLFPGEMMSQVKLCEQLLQAEMQKDKTQGLNFALDSAMECALMAGSLGSILSTSCPISLTETAPAICSSNESSGSEQSILPQFLGGGQPISSASAMWTLSYANISSLVGEQTSQTFGFGGLPSDDTLQEACTPNGKYSQLGNAPSAPLHDGIEFNTSQLLSFTAGQQMTLNSADLQTNQKEFNSLHHLNLSSLVSGPHSSFNGTGTAQNAKQSSEANSGKTDMTVPFGIQSEAPNGNGTGCNGVARPRARARRGQATDPHSIAERLRREKISDRMKNLQELVPNSNKTDKASMLDEIIEYVKFLQLQVKVLSISRLGATEAVVPLLTESQNESSGLLVSLRSGGQGGGFTPSELQDSSAFEQEVVQLMENNMTTAMQYLQNKGLCLMPIALATAISNQKGTSSATIPPGRSTVISRCTGGYPETDAAGNGKADVKKVDALEPLSSARGMSKA